MNTPNFWSQYRKSIMLIFVGGGIDTIGFIALFGFFTNHVTGNLVMAGASLVSGEDPGLWIKLSAIPLFIVTVITTQFFIDRMCQKMTKHEVIFRLFLAEAFFLTLFMIVGLIYTPFERAGTLHVAITAALGLIALAIRNTSEKTLMVNFTPGTVMTGNTTALGVNINNYLKHKSAENKAKLNHSIVNVVTFVVGALLGALLFDYIGFWSIAFFIPAVLGLAYISKIEKFFKPE